MRTVVVLALALALGIAGAAAEETASPHDMLLADGQPDTDKCALCHEQDMSLSRSKLETCTLCHSETVHAGAHEHLRADAARVARLVPAPREGEPALPLADDGRIFCGTCHVFHDPRISEEKVLDRPWVPGDPLAEAVRRSLASQVESTLAAHASAGPAKFSDGTKRLRLPVADGTLCRHCHRFGK